MDQLRHTLVLSSLDYQNFKVYSTFQTMCSTSDSCVSFCSVCALSSFFLCSPHMLSENVDLFLLIISREIKGVIHVHEMLII